MKTSSLLLVGLISGIVLGSGGRILLPRDGSAPPNEVRQGADSPVFAKENDIPVQSDGPRPTFEEVCEADFAEGAGVLVRYLKGATLEEVTALMEEVAQGDTEIEQLLWVIQTQGLELDAVATLAWTRKAKNRHLLGSLYEQWAIVDPKAALLASRQDGGWHDSTVLTAMKEGDLDRGIAALNEVAPNSPLLTELKALAVGELAANDVHAALEKAQSETNPLRRRRSLKAVIDVWVTKDPMAAVAWIEEQEDLVGANEFMEIAIEKLAETQPHLARTKLAELPASKSRSLLEGTIVKQWAAQDPNGALGWLKSLPSNTRRDHLFASMALTMEKRPDELLQLAQEFDIDFARSYVVSGYEKSLPNGGHTSRGSQEWSLMGEKIRLAALELAEESPQKALAALYDLNGLEEPTLHSNQIFKNWVDKEPEMAAEWVANLPNGDLPQSMQRVVYETWAEKSPESAAHFLTRMNLLEDREPSHTIARKWVEKDPQGALEWIDQLEAEVRSRIFSDTIYNVAHFDPILALQYMDRLGDTGAQNQLLKMATSSWREKDPQGVMAWFENQPMEADVDDLVTSTAKEWVLNGPVEASKWIGDMEISPRRDQAVAGMVHALISSANPSKDFEAAERWVQTITDADLKQKWSDEIGKRR